MAALIQRGTPERPRFYVRYFDADGLRHMKALKGIRTKSEAQKIADDLDKETAALKRARGAALSAKELALLQQLAADERRLIEEHERWVGMRCPTCGHVGVPDEELPF